MIYTHVGRLGLCFKWLQPVALAALDRDKCRDIGLSANSFLSASLLFGDSKATNNERVEDIP